MADLIQPTRLDLAAIQTAALEAALLARRLSGHVSSELEAQQLFDLYVRRVKSIKGAITEVPEFFDLDTLDSEHWNRFVEILNADLRTLYDILGTIEATSRQMEVVSRSDFIKTKTAILKAINQLKVYQFLKDNPDWQDMKVLDFTRAINSARRKPAAVIDSDIRSLEIPPESVTVVSTPRSGSRRVLVDTKVLGGIPLGELEEDFPPENAIDADPKTYWVQVASAKGPIQQEYAASWGSYVAQGAVFEYKMRFSHPSIVNNMKLLPFFEHPYNIIDIRYSETPSPEKWLTLPGFYPRMAVEDWEEFDFGYVAVGALLIVIEQPNYTRTVSSVPESVLYRNQLWAKMRASEYTRNLHEIDLTTAEEGKTALEPERLAYLATLEQADRELGGQQFSGERSTAYKDYTKYTEAMNRVMDKVVPGVSDEVREQTQGRKVGTKDEVRQVISYDYMAGIRSVRLSNIRYLTHAYYESGEFVSAGSVIQASLETDEWHHPFFEDDQHGLYRFTSIEYDLEIAPSTRFPIVPSNYLEGSSYLVRDEYLNLVAGRGRLRFLPSALSVIVRANGKRLPMGDFILSGQDVTINGWDPGAVYTATYAVDESATLVEIDGVLDSVRLLEPEVFDGTDGEQKVSLAAYPYVIYEIVRAQQFWNKVSDRARWEWSPEFYPLSEGTVALTQASKNITLTKTNAGDRDFDDVPFDRFTGTSLLKIWIQDTGEILDVDPDFANTDVLANLKSNYPGVSITGSRFIMGRTITHDSRVFGLNVDFYEPIEVFVDDVKAINVTDYLNGEQPAMEPAKEGETRFSFLHSGRNLYFNAPIQGKKIRVSYSWLTRYLKLVATLRCTAPAVPIFTPKLYEARIKVKTTNL